VSVVIPCYRCHDTVARAVDSVFAQSALPNEVWLIDDASADGGRTLEALHKLETHYAARAYIGVIALPVNGGPSAARNAGWEASGQPYVAFLDADDAWHPRKLEIQHGWMAAHPEITLSGHRSIDRKTGQSCNEALPDAWRAAEVSSWRLLVSNVFATRTVMLQRAVSQRFDPARRRGEDYLLWLQLVLSGARAALLPLPLACHFKAPFGEGGLSEDLWAMEKAELAVYSKLCREGGLPKTALGLLVPLSLAKYVRRVLIRRFLADSR
jgi:glycosyltransferase involved in cell wall biosynthesis